MNTGENSAPDKAGNNPNEAAKEKAKKKTLHLSKDFFGVENAAVDVTVKVLYGSEKGDIISQNVRFTKIYRKQYRRHGKTRQTVLNTIQICIRQNVLREYLINLQ